MLSQVTVGFGCSCVARPAATFLWGFLHVMNLRLSFLPWQGVLELVYKLLMIEKYKLTTT